MLSKEDNDLLTQTDRGTPMGELFRRFWIPVLLSEEVPLPDCPPVRVRVLGENLIAFRDSDGRVGLVDSYCPHRGAPLYFGRNEDCGIRCLYHGWKFNVDGQCVDMPNIPNGDRLKGRMNILNYPTAEGVGMVWAYMGPAEKRPPLPDFGWWDLASEHYYVTKYEMHCNWFQAHEGDFDSTHAQFVHEGGPDAPADVHALGEKRPRTLPGIDTPVGYAFATAYWNDDDKMNVLIRHNLFPSTCPPGVMPFQGGGQEELTFAAEAYDRNADLQVFANNFRIPIDDEHMWHFRLRYSPGRPLNQTELSEFKTGGYVYEAHEPGSWRMKGNKDNDYLLDRILQKQYNYSGMTAFQRQDAAMIEDQFGTITDRTREHLVGPDICFVQSRNRYLAMCKGLAEGKDLEEPFLMAERPLRGLLPESLPLQPAATALPDEVWDGIARDLNTVRIPTYRVGFDAESVRELADKTWDEVTEESK